MNLGDMESFEPVPHREGPKPDLPPGWEPMFRYEADSGEGEVVTPDLPEGVEPNAELWDRIIADFGFRPEHWEIIDESISLIGWKSPVSGAKPSWPEEKKTINLTRYKVRIRERKSTYKRADVDELISIAKRRKKKPPLIETQVDQRALVVALADLQIGKGEGDGSMGTIQRVKQSFDGVHARLEELKKLNRGVETVYVVGMGDLVEHCSGHYPAQEFMSDLDRRQQMRVVQHLLFQFIDDLVMAGYEVVAAAVPGNHGENRKDGKAFTNISDNDDLAVFENVSMAMAANPERYASVTTYLPGETYSFTLDIGGVGVGFFHGHVTGGGSTPQQRIHKWWQGQIMGNMPSVRDAQILVTAHYHHFTTTEISGRTHFQCPTLDPGSRWFSERTGQTSPQGLLTFVAGTGCGPRGYDDLRIL